MSMDIVGNTEDHLTTTVNINAANWNAFCLEMIDTLLYGGDT